jgi:hypothetical protein
MTDLTDIWVCANCRSINNNRAKQCYQCRTPKERAAVDPSQVDATTKGALREIELPDYQPSRPFAFVASPLIIAVGIVQGLNTLFSSEDVAETVDETGATLIDLGAIGPLGIATFVVAALALVAFAAWLGRAVGAMPALGLGYPAATSVTAFLEVFIPGLNLMRIPAILRDVIRRLEPQEGRGDVLIYAAWIGLFGGLILPRVGIYLGLFGADTIEEGARTLIIVRFLSTLLVVFGAVTLVALIWWLEGRMAVRRERQLAGVPAPAPVPADQVRELALSLPTDREISFRPQPATAPPAPEPRRPAVAPVAPPPAPSAPAPPAAPAPDPVLTRSITAATGAASLPAEQPGSAPSPAFAAEVESSPPVAQAPVAHGAAASASPADRRPSEPATVPTGPHLRIEISADGRIVAMLGDEEPETVTADELREAAPALAEAGGRATIVGAHPAGSGDDVATALAAMFRAAGVPTTVEPQA